VHMDDLMLRRTMNGMLGLLNMDLLKEMTQAVGTALGWSPDRAEAEIERTVEIFARQHGVTLAG
jgi:glycerol-3-phosphate dehydrogenase